MVRRFEGGEDFMPVFSGTAAADRLVGSAAADQIYGLGGDDKLYGADGNDWLLGGLGADILVGGLGDDSYDVDSAADQVVERAGEGVDRVRASISHQLAANVEILTLSGTADINGFGNALSNTIVGNAGNNVLNGGAGADAMAGGAGNDVYDVDSAGDIVSEAASSGYDRVRASVSFTLGANFEELNLTGGANINGIGNGLANTIAGNAGANVLDGKAGDDVLIGGAGDDTYYFDVLNDRAVETAGGGFDHIFSSVSSVIMGNNVEAATLTGHLIGLRVTGNVSSNIITGNDNVNYLDGYQGDDVLIGGGGSDFLSGDSGADRFEFVSAADGRDYIDDFAPLQGDKLVFVGLLHGTFGYLGAGAFSAGGDSEARFSGGQVFVDVDGNGVTDITIVLDRYTSPSQLQASDFVFS